MAGVALIHDAGGMSQDIRRQADWLAGPQLYLAIAPDLFCAATATRCLFATLSTSGREEDTRSTTSGRPGLAGARPDCSGKGNGFIGFSMGARFALALAPVTGSPRRASITGQSRPNR